MNKLLKLIHFFLVFVLAAGLLAPATVPVAQAKQDEPRAHPALLQLAAEHPDDTFMVIIQREVKNKDLKDDDPEIAVNKAGGKVGKQLTLIESFSAELTGKEIEKLAKNPKVRWISFDAPLVSTAAPGIDSVRDEFITQSYGGNNGTVSWASNWLESGESTSPSSGYIRVVSNSACAGGSGYCLRFDPYSSGRYVYRKLNLSGAASATLSFYRNNVLTNENGAVALEISGNGGATWATLRTYSKTSYLGSGTDTFDIAAYAGADTRIRFRITSTQTNYYYIYFDNIQIEYALASAFLSTTRADQLSLNGQGVTVAVIDSGVTSSHPDFTVSSTNTTSRVIANTKFGSFLTTEDIYGHGTHVAGIVAGNGNASNGKYKGVAPDVNLVNVKVSNDIGLTFESDLVAGLQWVYDNKDAYNIRVVNISMNSTVAQSYHTSPLDAAVEILWFNGIVVVVSAGNNGTAGGPSTLYPPANDPFVITVGATEDKGTSSLGDDNLAVFSAYGETEDGFAKPDLVAPGRNVVAPLGGLLNIIFQLHPLHRVNDYYFRMSGTSMSAPVVSGAVALLLQDEPNLNPDQVKYRLLATTNKNWAGYSANQSGAGYLDIYAAVNGATTQSANTGITASLLLSSGSDPAAWGSVNWNSVNWNAVNWNSVNWNSVNWNSVNWNSAVWDD